MRGVNNAYAGISGSDPTSGFVEMAVRELGPEHVLYGSDIRGAQLRLPARQGFGREYRGLARRLVLGGNMRRLMAPVMKARGMKV